MISVVVPIYNEQEIIPILHRRVMDTMSEVGEDWEVVYVNDGSADASLSMLHQLHSADDHVVVVDLSRNFGHMGALSAGLLTAQGDAVVLMDGDLQDPPEVIPEFVAAWRQGAQVVNAVRRTREEGRKALAVLFPLFYRVLGALSDFPIPLNCGIFGLLDRQAVDSLNALREGNRYLPGLRAWVGYRTAIVYYDRHDRIGGEGKLTFLSRIRYATDAITSFSYKPLRLSFVFATLTGVLAMVSGIVAVVPGATANRFDYGMLASVFLVGSFLLFCVGILGEYMARVYDEVRGRPLSIIHRVYRTGQAAAHRIRESDMERIFPAA
jgi:polyisoprenyl-phosphate glycosyltransferase